MIIDSKQIFWKMQYCYGLIPIVQVKDGHVLLTTKREVESYNELEAVEVFDLSLTTALVCKALESFHGCLGSNVHIQNAGKQSKCKQMIVHIIPRKSEDPKVTDGLYEQLETYPDDLLNHYREKMNFYLNAYANKILEGLHEQAKKYEAHVNLCFKEEKQI